MRPTQFSLEENRQLPRNGNVEALREHTTARAGPGDTARVERRAVASA